MDWVRRFYGLIGSVYGWSASYGAKFHAGQDYPWGAWTEIPAPGTGRVAAKGWSSAAGNWVSIIIGSRYFLFYHMAESSNLQVGQLVQPGWTVGFVGSTGDSTGPHLHLAVSNNPYPGEGNRVDPRPVIAELIAANSSSGADTGNTTPYPTPATPAAQGENHMLIIRGDITQDNAFFLYDPLLDIRSALLNGRQRSLAGYAGIQTITMGQASMDEIPYGLEAATATGTTKLDPAVVTAAIKSALTSLAIPGIDPAAVAAAVESTLADDFARVNANINDIPVGFTPIIQK